jgi:two-component system, cell cycle response regulator
MTKILVADDDAAIRDLVAQVLQADGHQVVVAADGAAAWQLFCEQQPEVVLADIRMPGKTGLELLADIKQSSPRTLVIIMTSHASMETSIEALKNGAYDYLVKPFDSLELISCAARRAVDSVKTHSERDSLVAALTAKNAELEQLNALFRELAVKDGLTGLYNHRFAQESLVQETERALRFERPLSVLFVDVDHFKAFNDTYGHQAGDLLLKALAARLQALARKTDRIARWGGEEFVLILPETDTDEAVAAAHKLRTAIHGLALRPRGSNERIKVSVSVGVATLGRHAGTPTGLVMQADRALYEAKRGGRNTVRHAMDFMDETTTTEKLGTGEYRNASG